MTATYIAAKLHGITVTDASLDYPGSVGISRDLLDTAGIDPYEQVHVVNLSTGDRWITYALSVDAPGVFTLNGGGARLGMVGDRCVVMSFRTSKRFKGATAVHLTALNQIDYLLHYLTADADDDYRVHRVDADRQPLQPTTLTPLTAAANEAGAAAAGRAHAVIERRGH